MILLIITALILSVLEYFVLDKYFKIEKDKKFYIIYVSGVLANIAATVVLSLKFSDIVYSCLMLVYISLLFVIGSEDILKRRIDAILSLILVLLGIVISFFVPNGVFWKIILFSLIISAVMYLFAVKSNEAVGKGDVICIGAATLCFTFDNVFPLMIYTLIICLVYGLIQLLCKKIDVKQGMPFVPFLVVGMILTLIFA